MDSIYPYVEALFVDFVGNIGWPAGFHRDFEIKSVIERVTKDHLEAFKVDDLVDYEHLADRLFAEWRDASVIQIETQPFAGDYYRISSAGFKNYRTKFLEASPIYSAKLRIGERFYPDVFDGYRKQVAREIDDPDAKEISLPVATANLEAVDWKQREAALTPSHIEEIQERARGLISAINQAELDERTRENALAHATAVIDLLQAPDPPWREIVDLLNSPVLCAILNAVAIMQLILGPFS